MSNMRISGIVSGFDTDQMVKDLMKAEQLKVDNVEKQRKLVEYEQESYREIIDLMRGDFLSYFDILKPSTNIRSATSFAKFNYSITENSVSSNKVSVTASTTLNSYNHSITEISQLATKDTWVGTDTNIKGIKTNGFDLANLKTTLGTDDFKMTVAIGSTSKTIQISNADINAMANVDDLANRLNTEISNSFGADYSNVVTAFDANGDLTNDEIEFDMVSNSVKLFSYAGNESTMTGLGIVSGSSNYDYQNLKISDIFDLTSVDISTISINGNNSLGLSNDDTISTFMSKLNGAGVDVEISFNALNEKFELKASAEGSANNISMDDANTVSFFNVLGIDAVNRTSGVNAKLKLDGVDIIQGSNTFNVDGVTYTLKDTHLITDDPIDINITQNTSSIIDNIKGFVEKYNALIGKINDKLTEKKYYDYKPLTDEEIKAVSEDEAKLWKEKSSSGLLRNSSELQSIVSRMRTALYESVENVGITLDQIGIKTSTDYKDNGKLLIDENKLQEALETNYDNVVALFTNESDKQYLDADNATERYNENGIANRLYDVIQDSVRLTRDDGGKKGILLEKAGLVGDISMISNTLQLKIDDYNSRMDSLLELLSDKEEAYYTSFAKMESALSELQNQSTWLTQQLG